MNALIVLLCLAICIEVIRDLSRAGDFKGYVNAGLLAWKGQDIYSDVYNTWPPFFSFFSIPLAWLDQWSPVFNRLIWLSLTLLAFIGSVHLSTSILFQKSLRIKATDTTISIKNVLVLVPILLIFRFVLDNLSNIQINIFLLYGCILSYYLFSKSQPIGAAIVLAFIISLKVIPIFILFYFIYKRKWVVAGWTLLFLLIFNAISLLYFGFEEGIAYYQTWMLDVAPNSYIANRKNQSVIGGLLRLLTQEDTNVPFTINLISLPKETVIKISYLVVALTALIPAYIFRATKGITKPRILNIIEFSFILTAIPILSPLSWKAYFIFLWFPYFLLYYILYHSHYSFDRLRLLKRFFLVSVLLTTFSSELFVGRFIAHRLEVYSVVTIGSIVLLIIQLLVYNNIKKNKKSASIREALD